ncbi:MAG TPA: HAD-IIA family hydrolase [Myxococcota bacterium]|nr:HAD-IIA family hydrolase [Myxococcota bacterium]HNZ04381.1 HAD-IIA family hydrolase [Myxococcota bacterium]HOD08591.1 HAD-IIA family hydrolase [Myxococcota bacterium]HPB51606.1 HAD-IIA family hydrolase [Myxococcota bacterium]HQP96538.1 HAD-IIA family hydrolase [Myxococcota bacterium]
MKELSKGAADRIRKIKAFALDMDGTVYLGGRLLPGTPPFLKMCAERGIPHVFLTNNSSKSCAEYVKKLNGMGIAADLSSVMTSGEAAIRYLHREYPGRTVYLCATPSFEQEVREAGIPLARGRADADMAVLAFDTTLTYQRLVDLCDIVRDGKPFVATHPDNNCPVDGGYIPDVGAMLALVRTSTGRDPDFVVGKPSRLMIGALCDKLGLQAADIAYCGDRLYTDIRMAVDSGMVATLVLSGETTLDDVAASELKPDIIFDDLGEIAEFMGS